MEDEMMEVDENSDSDPDENFVITWTCPHIERLKENKEMTQDMLASYELLHAFYISFIAKGSSLKRKNSCCICYVKSCKRKQEKIHACLSCIYFGCKRHIRFHAVDRNHPLAVDIDFGHLFCCACRDYKYDADFCSIAEKNNVIASHQRGIQYKWKPAPEEIYLLKCHEVVYNYKMGARGIINDDRSCYLIVLVQSFVHAPSFRDYLLSFKHKCHDDIVSDDDSQSKEAENIDEIRVPECFICEMAVIVQEYFSDKKGPMALGGLCFLLMKLEDVRLIMNFQNDCTYFFDILLNQLHENTGYISQLNLAAETDEGWLCKCDIHTMYGIPFSKKKMCNNCKSVSIKKEYEWKITLYEDRAVYDGFARIIPLKNCLKSYFYGEIQNYYCSVCNNKAVCITEELPEELPSILSFASSIGFTAESQNCFMQYDEFLDMSDFVLPSASDPKQYKYYLFAVIEYDRVDTSSNENSEAGHYMSYVRLHSNLWFKCNDCFIDKIDVKEVLKTKSRMVFYQKMFS